MLQYWEGKLANGKCVQFEETDIDNNVCKLYADPQKLQGSDSNGFVAVSKTMDVLTVPVGKTLPILSVKFKSEEAIKCNKATPLSEAVKLLTTMLS